jgi:hypothetical protein
MKINNIHEILASDEAESFSVAFLFHSIVLLLLCLVVSAVKPVDVPNIIISSIDNEENIVEQIPITIEEIHNFDSESTSFNENITVATNVEDTSLKIDTPDVPSVINPETDLGIGIPNSELLSDNLSGVSTNIGAGLSTQSSTGGALDRLTVEIIDNAQTKDVNVIWLFDASVSLNHQRQQIYDRFDKILQEIDIAQAPHIIKHAICSFGSGINFLTDDPTDSISTLKKHISEIIIDDSGIENTFNAIGQACKEYSKPKTRSLIVVFTDEIGDDISLSDTVGNFARMKNCTVYVVGSPAPFGKSTTQFKFVEFDPKYESLEKWVEIQQGPETLADMILDIRSLPIDDETLDSGFGPFALSKLCADTGGIFFSIHPNRGDRKNNKKDISPLSSYISRFFDHNVMSKYRPDYRSVFTQNKENTTHLCKQALIKACSIPLNISGEQTLRFRAFNEGMFAEELGMAQRFSAKLEPKINEVYNALMIGEPTYKTLDDKRWIASYALAMGRILSTKCRIESYNLVLAEAKTGLKKKDPKTNIWILLPSTTFAASNSILLKNYTLSQKYLNYVIENFPDTPWALIAKEELNTPVGYSWIEEYQEPPKPNNGGGGNNNPQDDQARPKLIPKPARKINKI